MDAPITSRTYRKLVLCTGRGGISWCCIDTLNHRILQKGTAAFEKNVAAEQELSDFFQQNQDIPEVVDEVQVLHSNAYNTFVPDALFDENYIGSFLQYNIKVFESDMYASDALASHGMHNVYVPLMNINNYLIDRFGSFEYRHSASVLVTKLLENSRNIDEKQVFVHLQDDHFEIVAVRGQKLMLYNCFEYHTAEDFLYHLLFTMEQLFLNPETAKVQLLGKVDEDHPAYLLAYNYIRNISFYEPDALMDKYEVSQQEALENFIIYNA